MDNDIIAVDDKEGRLAVRNEIDNYEVALQEHLGSKHGDMDKINEEGLTEYIIGGAYTRILDIPAGVTIVSNLWKRERLWIIISGEVKFKTELGTEHVVGPYIAHAPFGSKVALIAITDVKWAAITGVETEDLEEIEEELKADDYTSLTYSWDLLEDKR